MQKRLVSSSHSTKRPGHLFNTPLKYRTHRLAALERTTHSKYFQYYDFPVLNLLAKLYGIRKQFRNIGFIGPNPVLFLSNLPQERKAVLEKFTVINPSQEALERLREQVDSAEIDKPASIEYYNIDLEGLQPWD